MAVECVRDTGPGKGKERRGVGVGAIVVSAS
jgi:hypothetical protein